MADEFSDGEAYERFMGRWSRLVAPTFVAWLDASPGLRWLDVGCGTGALTSAILAGAAPAQVLAVDPSPAFVAAARRDLAGQPAVVQVASADALPADDTSVDVVVSGLVLNFLPDVSAALREQVRAVRPGGTVAAFVWDYAQGMQPLHLFWQAVAAVVRVERVPIDDLDDGELTGVPRFEAHGRHRPGRRPAPDPARALHAVLRARPHAPIRSSALSDHSFTKSHMPNVTREAPIRTNTR